PYAVDRVANWPGDVSGAGIAQPKKLDVPWVLGLPVEGFVPISVAKPNGWAWPADPPPQATNAAARATIAKLFDDAIAAAIGTGNMPRADRLKVLKTVVLDAMRARAVARRRFADEKPVHNLLPRVRRDLPAKDIDIAKLPAIKPEDTIDLLASV